MKSIFIPPLDSELTLADDWTFKLHMSGRNRGLIRAMKVPFNIRLPEWDRGHKPLTLRTGTRLIIRNYRIRQRQDDSNSVTLSANINGKMHRFFADLEDVNRIVAIHHEHLEMAEA